MSISEEKTLPKKRSVSAGYIKSRIENFSFTEVADILNFLCFTDNGTPECSDYMYIRGKIDRCLRNHDNGEGYFVPLWELDCILAENNPFYRR